MKKGNLFAILTVLVCMVFCGSVDASVLSSDSTAKQIDDSMAEQTVKGDSIEMCLSDTVLILRDSIASLDSTVTLLYGRVDSMNQEIMSKQDSMNSTLWFFICLLILSIAAVAYLLFRMQRLQKKTADDVTQLQELPEELRVHKESFDRFLEDYKQLCDNYNAMAEEQAHIKESLQTTGSSVEQSMVDVRKIVDNISINIKDYVAGLVSTAPSAPAQTVDKVAYNAAVDAWIHINNHLCDMGRDRKLIPHVFSLLAGNDVQQSELQSDLASLDSDQRKEEVNTIISDINRFMVQHKPAIESWLAQESCPGKLLRDVVRFPLGLPFNDEMDEELTGDDVPSGAIVSMVASLGYLFPGSTNGCYRVKSKVVVQG